MINYSISMLFHLIPVKHLRIDKRNKTASNEAALSLSGN